MKFRTLEYIALSDLLQDLDNLRCGFDENSQMTSGDSEYTIVYFKDVKEVIKEYYDNDDIENEEYEEVKKEWEIFNQRTKGLDDLILIDLEN